jgi:hypothetical protein
MSRQIMVTMRKNDFFFDDSGRSGIATRNSEASHKERATASRPKTEPDAQALGQKVSNEDKRQQGHGLADFISHPRTLRHFQSPNFA